MLTPEQDKEIEKLATICRKDRGVVVAPGLFLALLKRIEELEKVEIEANRMYGYLLGLQAINPDRQGLNSILSSAKAVLDKPSHPQPAKDGVSTTTYGMRLEPGEMELPTTESKVHGGG
jgi:hypothetical protein